MATIEEFQISLSTFMENFSAVIMQIAEQLLPIIQQIYNALHDKYLEAGAPYGDTQEGLLRWMDEIAEIRHMEMRIEEITSSHQALALLRKRITEKREIEG